MVTVSVQDAPLQLELPGRLSASQRAEIRPQVGGLVQKRLFTEGGRVVAGQPLYQLDAASFEAERARTAAALQKAEAQLAAARVRTARDAELLKVDAISRQGADDSAAAQRLAEADVAVAKAALDAAVVQLQRARIVAPISGRIEVSTVTPGALVTANQTQALVRLRQQLQGGPQRIVDVFPALFHRSIGEKDEQQLSLATGEAVACMNYLIAERAVDCTVDGNGVAWYALK